MSVKKTGSLDQALNRLVSSKAQHVQVGVIDGSKYPDGTSVASVAFWNEYGTRKIPPRPFFRDTIKQNKEKWVELAAKSIRAGYTVEHMLGLVGSQMMTDVVYTATQWTSPPNAAYTIAKKGFNKPLTDTGMMIAAIKHEVVDGEM